MNARCYSELKQLGSFEERYEYLKVFGSVGQDTFGFDRYLNQQFYTSLEWKRIRDEVIVRDNGCDLGVDDYEIYGKIFIHHMNPISPDDFKYNSKFLLIPEFLVCTSFNTHNAIHYGNLNNLIQPLVIREQHDTCPWRH